MLYRRHYLTLIVVAPFLIAPEGTGCRVCANKVYIEAGDPHHYAYTHDVDADEDATWSGIAKLALIDGSADFALEGYIDAGCASDDYESYCEFTALQASPIGLKVSTESFALYDLYLE